MRLGYQDLKEYFHESEDTRTDDTLERARVRQSEFIRKVIRGAFNVESVSYFNPYVNASDTHMKIDPIQLICASRKKFTRMNVLYICSKAGLKLPNYFQRQLDQAIAKSRDNPALLQSWTKWLNIQKRQAILDAPAAPPVTEPKEPPYPPPDQKGKGKGKEKGQYQEGGSSGSGQGWRGQQDWRGQQSYSNYYDDRDRRRVSWEQQGYQKWRKH